MKKFRISYTLDIVLTEAALYPDGAPDQVNEDAVHELIRVHGGMPEVIRDWNLEHGNSARLCVTEVP